MERIPAGQGEFGSRNRSSCFFIKDSEDERHHATAIALGDAANANALTNKLIQKASECDYRDRSHHLPYREPQAGQSHGPLLASQITGSPITPLAIVRRPSDRINYNSSSTDHSSTPRT